MTPEQELAYIAAFIDGEGYVSYRRQCGGKKIMRRIGFVNTDKALVDTVAAMLTRASLSFTIQDRRVTNPRHSQRWDCYLTGGKEVFKRFFDLIPLQHAGKRERLELIISQYLTLEEANYKRAKSRSDSLTAKRKREIAENAAAVRWSGHELKGKKRVRIYTEAQKEHRNNLDRLRKRARERAAQAAESV